MPGLSGLNWRRIVDRYADSHPEGLLRVPELLAFRDNHPMEMTRALDRNQTDASKPEISAFFMVAVEEAARDHLVTDAELSELEHVARILRIQEGDLFREQESKVREVLCREIGLLLTDLRIDPEEALYKVRLQRLLGVGYDAFTGLIAHEIERIVALLVDSLGAGAFTQLTPDGKNWIRLRLNALDKVFRIHSHTSIRNITNFDF